MVLGNRKVKAGTTNQIIGLMKILQVIDKLDVGGAERVAVNLCSLLFENKIEVSFLNLLQPAKLDEELIQKGIKLQYLNRRNKYNPIYLLKMFFILNRYTIVHVHSRHVLRYIGITFFLPKFFRNFKVVFHDHYGEIDSDNSISPYLKKCINKCDAYIGVSPSLVHWARENKLNNKIFLLENIVRESRSFKEIATDSKIVAVGNFRKQKNYEFLLTVLKNLPEHIKIDLYGAVVDDKYYNDFIDLTKSLGLTHRIHISTSEKSVAEILPNYSLAIHCAASETGPLAAIEFMSKGMPLIMFNTGSVAKVLKENGYGFIMDIFDEREWTIKVNEILNNPSLQSNLATQLKMIHQNFFSEKTYFEKCLKIYQVI